MKVPFPKTKTSEFLSKGFYQYFEIPMHALGGKANKRSLRSAFRIIPAPAIPPPKKLKVYSRKTERKSNFLSTSKAQKWLQELQQ